MHPFVIVLLSIFLPLLMLVLVIGPIYAGAYLGLILLYGSEVAERALDIDFQLVTYEALFEFLHLHGDQAGWLDFILPAFGPVVLGLVSGLVFFFLFVRYVRSVILLS